MPAEQDALTMFYNRRHPAYDGLLAHWEFCESCYHGGRDWIEANLFKYQKEGDEEFKARKARAMRLNHTKEAVDLVQKYLFKSPIQRNVEDAPEPLKAFWTRSMRSGQSIDELMRLIGTSNALTGRVALVVDSTRPAVTVDGEEKPVISQAEAEETRGSVYAYVVMPRDILDYAWSDEDGELLWIKLREYVRDDKDPVLGTGFTTERVRLWTRQGWELYELAGDKSKGEELKASLVDAGVHGLGFVPVKLCDHAVATHPFRVAGLVDDIAYLDRGITNYMSNLDAIIQDQTFSQLAIPAQALTGDKKSASKHIVEMGTKRIFTYDGGSGSTAKPEFISPDPKQAGVIEATINMLITQIYSTIGLAGERTKQDNAMGIDNSSGVAKAYDFQRVNSLLLSKAKRLEHVEEWIVTVVLAWNGESAPDESLVTYPTTFDVASLNDELVTAEALQKVQAPIEVRREHMRAIVEKLLPQVTDEVWSKLMTAVDAWQDVNEVTAQATLESIRAGTEASKAAAKTAGSSPKPAASDKPVAAKSRQGSVTPTSKNTPKNSAK
jgi:Arc/MetJ family transcription regulator